MERSIGYGVVAREFRASAPRNSEDWATTDRGWLTATDHPSADFWDGNAPIGNYLDYGPCGPTEPRSPFGSVHACFTPWRKDPVTGSRIYFASHSRYFQDTATAALWIAQRWADYKPLCA